MLEDIFKLLTYLMVVHLMVVVVDNKGEIFDDNLLRKLLYSSIAMVIYHMVIRKVFFSKKGQRNFSGRR